jgi:shikimate kinase
MKHFLLIGFSCTGKTHLGEQAFGKETVIDSDKEVWRWVANKENQQFDHIYEIYMRLGRDRALSLIKEAEKALIDKWADDTSRKVISLGPGFPLHVRGGPSGCGHEHWERLRAKSDVVLLSKSVDGIYDGMKKRREKIFEACPEAKKHDNWDVGVMVDGDRTEFSKDDAVSKIEQLLKDREVFY